MHSILIKLLTLQQRGIWTCVSPPGPHHPNSFLLRAGREPGIPVREAGALTRNTKGYSLLHQSLERLFLRWGEWGLHIALTGIHLLHEHQLFYLICVILMFCFLKQNHLNQWVFDSRTAAFVAICEPIEQVHWK